MTSDHPEAVVRESHEGFRYQEHELNYFPEHFQFLWPIEDESLAGDLPTLVHLDTEVLPHLPGDRRCVVLQAGGAIGAWPKRFAQLFDLVYTFEPYPPSFRALVWNCPEQNVIKFNAALGDVHRMVKMDFPEHRKRSATGKENIGGYRVIGAGDIPMLKIDDFNFPRLDLLYLDLEGYELMALKGGITMIRACQPYIVLEDKAGCCHQFGYQVGDVEKYLAHEVGYRTIKRFHGGRDVMLAPGYDYAFTNKGPS